jgi:thiol-disulfide isomerase/thioredoxin
MLALCPIFFVLNVVMTTSVAGQDIDWQYDIKSGISKAEAENKLVLLHFTASWCRPCQALEKFVFPNLEVARSVNENVIPVHIDVDKEQSLVTEYGVTAVPFDVVITPGGRVIAKQKSPLDSNGYRRMMAGLSTPVKDLEDQSKVAIAQKMNEFSDQFNFKPRQISQFKNHTPQAPSHQPPVASAESAKLARRTNMISNPFFGAEETSAKPEPKSVPNSFAVSLDQETTAPAPTAKTVAMESNDFASGSKTRATEIGVAMTNNFSAKQNEEIKLEPPVLKSDFEVITGAEIERDFLAKKNAERKQQASIAKAKAFNEIAPKIKPTIEPKLSFQANAGPELTQLMQERKSSVKNPGLAENVPPVQVQQDRFFQKPTAAAKQSVNQTRFVTPKNTAQALLKPVHQIAQRFAPNQAQPKVDTSALATNQLAPSDRVQQLLQPQTRPQSILEQESSSQQQNVAASRQANANIATAVRQPVAAQPVAHPKPAVGLKGKCPVTLLQEGKWVAGDAKFGCIHRDRLYMFADAEKLKMFQANPDFFSPILAGFDPVVFHKEGRLVDGLAEHGVFMGKAPNQRVLLFRDAQTRAMFQAQPAAYMNTVRQAMNAGANTNRPMVR